MTDEFANGDLNDEKRSGCYRHSHYAVSEKGLPLGLLDAATLLAMMI